MCNECECELSQDNEQFTVRVSAFDFVTVGTFESVKDIKVVDLSGISNTSPFVYTNKLEYYALNRKVFKDIAFEIAKPLRRSDSILEYIPTQYITEFIKSQGYDGVEYASTMQTGGFNLAIFDESLFKCVATKVIEIKKLTCDTIYV